MAEQHYPWECLQLAKDTQDMKEEGRQLLASKSKDK